MPADLSTTARTNTGMASVRVALDANVGDVTAITLPQWCRELDIFIKQADDATDDAGKFATSGTDSAAVGDDFFPIPVGQGLSVPIGHPASQPQDGAVVVYIAAATASGFAHLLMRER